jgi:chromosome segregation ATPase
MKGMVTEVKTETVFYCEKDGIAKTSDEQALDCGNCGTTMSNIGWFEYNSDEEKVDKMTTLVEKHNSSQENAKQVLPATIEGGVDVAEENENADEQIVAGSAAPAVVPAGEEGQAQTEVDSSNEAVADNAEVKVDDEAVNDSTEKAADVSEVEVEEPDFAKMFGDLQSAIETGLVKTRESATADIAKATEAFEAKITELVGKHDELTNKFDSLKTELDSVEKRVDGVESETAVKKSGDLGGSTEDTLSKSKGTSKWGGRFLGISALEQ